MSYLCQKGKKIGDHRLCFRYKGCGKLPDCDKLAHVIQHGLEGFTFKNIEGESTEANELSLIL